MLLGYIKEGNVDGFIRECLPLNQEEFLEAVDQVHEQYSWPIYDWLVKNGAVYWKESNRKTFETSAYTGCVEWDGTKYKEVTNYTEGGVGNRFFHTILSYTFLCRKFTFITHSILNGDVDINQFYRLGMDSKSKFYNLDRQYQKHFNLIGLVYSRIFKNEYRSEKSHFYHLPLKDLEEIYVLLRTIKAQYAIDDSIDNIDSIIIKRHINEKDKKNPDIIEYSLGAIKETVDRDLLTFIDRYKDKEDVIERRNLLLQILNVF